MCPLVISVSKDNELVPVPPIYSITIAAQVICMMANLLLVYGAWKDRNVFHALWLITTCIATIIRALYVIHNVKYNQFDQSLASVTVIAFTGNLLPTEAYLIIAICKPDLIYTNYYIYSNRLCLLWIRG